ncbi:MAG: DUF4864 domain-containing protein [Chloroflexi bacterium]|nr:DUF4864 domain-containing protein [Chloroflexota bacterium]
MTSVASFCTNCGAQVAAGARFCTACGSPVTATAPGIAATPAAMPASRPAAPPPPPPWSAPVPQVAAAPRRTSHWKRNLVVVVLVFLVGVIGLAFFATSGPVEAVDRHLALLAQGDLRTAYAETSDVFKGQVTFEKFSQMVASYPILKQNTAVWTSRSINGDEAIIEGTLTAPDQTTKAKAEYHLASGSDGTWKITGFGVTPLK